MSTTSRSGCNWMMRRRERSNDVESSPGRCAAASGSTVLPPVPPATEKQREVPKLRPLLRRFWKVAAPYWSSDDKVQARIRLSVVLALTLATTGINVCFNFLGRDFYNAIADKNQKQFTKQLLYYLAAFAGGIPKLLICSRNLEFFTSGYSFLIQIIPAAVVAPMYFSGKIAFGVINQSVSAFSHILADFSLIVYQFETISAFAAVIDRLGEFDNLLDSSNPKRHSDPSEGISLIYSNVKSLPEPESHGSIPIEKLQKLVDIEHLTVETPSGTALVRNLSLVINKNEHLLVTGPSGSGKTSLLRAMCGLCSTGKGKIIFYVKDVEDNQPSISSGVVALKVDTGSDKYGELGRPSNRNYEGIFFLPQKPYMVLGTLRQQLLYPTWAEDAISTADCTKPTGSLPFLKQAPKSEHTSEKPSKPTTEDLIQVLEDVRLSYILSRFSSLDTSHEWSSVLSLGEQQRLAFARLLLSKPQLVILDESTSALDEANEVHLYQQIEKAGITYISVGHRQTLYDFHKKNLRISTKEPSSAEPNWSIESINRETV